MDNTSTFRGSKKKWRGGRGAGKHHPRNPNNHGMGGQDRRPSHHEEEDDAMDVVIDEGASMPPPPPPPQHKSAIGPPPKAFMTESTFSTLPLSNASKRALAEVLGFTYMTKVQDATLPIIMEGGDVMAKAKTGTGKTMAFLIPAIENLLKLGQIPKKGDVSVLILSPTRELASQIANEAKSLLIYHQGYRVDCFFGGTNINSERNRLRSQRIDFLVCTPGRLIDHLENSNLAAQLSSIRTLVLDEADQLLEMGFRPAIEKILSFVPKNRQTLLFSATLPKGVTQVASLAMRRHKFIDTVGTEDADTNVQVKQSLAIVELDQQFEYVYTILSNHRKQPDYKVIAFFTTARLTQYYAELMTRAGLPVMEIHSRKSQAVRTKTSDTFRQMSNGILFSSDVSARGVDYPDITMVIQVGIPSSKEQYIHRLGRTGRAGKEGEGILVLAPDESFFAKELRELPVTKVNDPRPSEASQHVISDALMKVDNKTSCMAYQTWLGYYNSVRGLGWSKPKLVEEANRFSSIMGMSEPPPLLKKTIGMMGLRGVPGLRIETDTHAFKRGGGGRGGGRGGGGRGRGRGRGGFSSSNGGCGGGGGGGEGSFSTSGAFIQPSSPPSTEAYAGGWGQSQQRGGAPSSISSSFLSSQQQHGGGGGHHRRGGSGRGGGGGSRFSKRGRMSPNPSNP